MKLFYNEKIKPNLKKIGAVAAGILVVGLGIVSIITWHNIHSKYFYIDMDGNKGVANMCVTSCGGLICEKGGGHILVKQYYKGN